MLELFGVVYEPTAKILKIFGKIVLYAIDELSSNFALKKYEKFIYYMGDPEI
jgi:hypothetical protein